MSELYEMLKKTNVAISLQRYELAVTLAQKVLTIAPNNPFAYYLLSLANLHLKNLDEAEKFVKLALSYEPNLENSLELYCGIMFLKEQYEVAIEKANEVLKINPQNEIAIYFKGCAYAKMKKFNDAENCFKQALIINPNSNNNHLKLADIYSNINQKELAEHEYLKALQVAPNDSVTLNNYGMHLLKQNWYSQKGLELIKASLKNEPNDKNVIDNYEGYLAFQTFFLTCFKTYKEVFEKIFSLKDFIIIVIISLILYFFEYNELLKIWIVIAPFFILYAISFVVVLVFSKLK